MNVRRNRSLRLYSAAKINLTLEVGPRRSDGNHDIRSVVQTIGLWDELLLEVTHQGGIELRCNWKELENDRNLCVRAARQLRESYGVREGCRLTLTKTIPTGAGLGGGSGNAAATLIGLSQLWNVSIEHDKLLALAESLGADVPLFLFGGSVLIAGVGERVTPLGDGPQWYVVIVKPGASVSTKWAYEKLDHTERGTRPQHEAMMAALAQSDLPACNQLLRNEMEEGVLVEYQDIQRAREALRQSPARGVLMSGSGSAVFGLFGDKEAAEMTAQGLPDHGEVFVAPFVNTGCRQAP